MKSLYIKSFCKGKGRLARIADRVFFCLFVSLASYLVSRSFNVRINAAAFIAVLCGMIFLFLHGIFVSKRLRSFEIKKHRELRLRIIKRQMLIESEAVFEKKLFELRASIPECTVEFFRKDSPIDIDDVCDAVKRLSADKSNESTKLLLITLTEPTGQAREFVERLKAPKIEFASFDRFKLLTSQYNVTDDDILAELSAEINKKPPKRKWLSAEIIMSVASKYRLLGAVLFISSYLMRFSFYLRTLSMLCFSMALFITARRYVRKLKTLSAQ